MSALNNQQYLASLPVPGVSLVVAGAGTGKTKVLVEKVKKIITKGIASPESILILTFSVKAAQEIKERVISGIGRDAGLITSGTFHSFCLGFLKKNSDIFTHRYGFKHFPKVLDKEEKDKLQKELLRSSLDRFLGLPVNVISGLLESESWFDKRMHKKLERMGIIREVDVLKKQFGNYKIANNLIEFDDMMHYTIDLLSGNNTLRGQAVSAFNYVFVDEFQDTSEENFQLLRLLLPDSKPNLFMVGDDWQSIYAFRGSSIDYIIRMKKYFPEAVIYKLTYNYRSKYEIVRLSNNFIKKNKYRTSKKLKAVKGRGGIINYHCVSGREEEIGIITDIIKNLNGNSGSTAVLYRNNWQGSFISGRIGILVNECNVKLMTMHASKGLEFDTVIIAGVSDDIIPDASSNIEEERRLFYVALTRAKENLYILHRKSADGSLSIFAEELGLPKPLL